MLCWRDIKLVEWNQSRVCVVLGEHCGPGILGQQPRGPTEAGGGEGGLQVLHRHDALSATAGGKEHPLTTGYWNSIPCLVVPAWPPLETLPTGDPCQAVPVHPHPPKTPARLSPSPLRDPWHPRQL